jgi:hypothetical protein
MKLLDNLNYRQWQKRNSLAFNQLDKLQQKEIRKKGYNNRGWNQVKKSWIILQEYQGKIISIFDHKLTKGDLIGAINIAMINSEETSNIASEAIATLEKNQQKIDELAEKTLNKYQPL